jgi:TIR domain
MSNSEEDMSYYEDRPEWLSYRAKDGIYTTYLPAEHGQSAAFTYFVDRAIAWSDKAATPVEASYGYSILDTFMADSLIPSHFEAMLHRASPSSPLRLLLADPYSAFGEARAAAIADGTAEDRSRTGAAVLLTGIENFLGRDVKGLDGATYSQLLKRINLTVAEFDVPLALRYYGVIPSGPMLFLKDILLAGNYCINLSSMRLPWLMIIDEPSNKYDRFNVYRNEFENIWHNYSVELPGSADEQTSATLRVLAKKSDHLYFISYARADVATADHVEVLLYRNDKRVIRDELNLTIGTSFEKILPVLIESSGTFIAIFSESYARSEYCMGELHAAMENLSQSEVPRIAILLASQSPELRRNIPLRLRDRLTASVDSREAREQAVARLVREEVVASANS